MVIHEVCTRLPLLESCFFPRTKGTSLCWLSGDSHHPLQRRWWWCPGPGCRSSRPDTLRSAILRQPQNSSTAPGMVPHLCRFCPSLPLSCPPHSRASPINNQKGEVKIKQNKSNKQASLKEWKLKNRKERKRNRRQVWCKTLMTNLFLQSEIYSNSL